MQYRTTFGDQITQMTEYVSTKNAKYANDNDKSLTFRPRFNEKVIKTSKNVGCLKQQDRVQTKNYNKTKFELFR